MKHVLPRFTRPIKSEDDPLMDVSYWSKAIDAYDAKNYKKALIETINYINSNVLKDHSTEDDIQVTQGQVPLRFPFQSRKTPSQSGHLLLRLRKKQTKLPCSDAWQKSISIR